MARRQLGSILVWMLVAGFACAAPEAPPRYELSMRAGVPLDEALQEIARQTGIQVLFFSQITAGHRAPEIAGEYTLDAAMARLLEGSGLTFRHANARTIEVTLASRTARRRAQSARSPTSVDPMQEVRVVATAEQLVASRIATPLSEIPQSISVISSEQIRQQNSFDLSDVMSSAPGIAVRRISSIDLTAYSRAFRLTSYHVDGGGALKPSLTDVSLYQGDPDLSEFDRVEILRGSDALFSGNSDPGGTVSLVRKRPMPVASLRSSATLGSWNHYRVELDATGPLTRDGALRGRADVLYASRNFFLDRAHQDRKKVFAVLDYDVGPESTLTLGGSYQWDDSLPVAKSLPLFSDGSDPHLPRRTGLTFDWSFYDTRVSQAYLQLRQRIGDNWSLRLNSSASRTSAAYAVGSFDLVIQKRTLRLGAPTAEATPEPHRFTLGTLDVTLTGEAEWLGLREVIAIGGDFTRVRGTEAVDYYGSFGAPLLDIPAFDPAAYPDPRLTNAPALSFTAHQTLEQYGAFASVQVYLDEALSLTAGARIAGDSLRQGGTVSLAGISVPTVSQHLGSSGVIQPYGALMYRINDHVSWYSSYADIYRTQNGEVSADGRFIRPARGANLETGLKGVWRDGALNGLLAVYRIEQRHLPVLVSSANIPPGCCYVEGTARSRGAELEISGELSQGWLLGSGYAYNSFESHDGTIPNNATPRHLLKLWMSTTLPGAFSQWTVGGSVRAQTSARGTLLYTCSVQSQNCVAGEVTTTRPYAVLDLRAGLQLNSNWQVALSVNNIFDKRYYLSQELLNVWYGDPRNFLVRIDAKY